MGGLFLLFIIAFLYGCIPSSSQRYVFVDEAMSNTEGEARCQALYGTSLASIHSSADNLEAQTLCQPQATDSRQACQIGLNDAVNEAYSNGNNFVWTDGTALDYQNWISGEPNDYYRGCCGAEEDYAMIEKATGKWRDELNGRIMRPLCNYGTATITADPTTTEPTTAEPTTAEPTTAEPTTAEPTTAEPTTTEPTTAEPTTAEPTTAEPTTAEPTTANPTKSLDEGMVNEETAEPKPSQQNGQFVESEKKPAITESLPFVIGILSLLLLITVSCACCLYFYYKKVKENKVAQDVIMSNDTVDVAVAPGAESTAVAPGETNNVENNDNVMHVTPMELVSHNMASQGMPPPPQVHDAPEEFTDDGTDDDADDLYDVDAGGVTAGGVTAGGNETAGNDIVAVQKCEDCGVVKSGKIYEENGTFYCWDCWALYE